MRFRASLLVLISTGILILLPGTGRGGNYTLSRVCIDAGHGGHDSGCIGGKAKEKDVALAIALKLGKYIEEHFPEVKVIYTRKTDVFLGLDERAAVANNAKADLFICIHCNSACYRDKKKKKDVCNEETNGVETWVMGLHKSEANLEVSKRENEVVLLEKDYIKKYDGFDPNSPEANIIFSLYQNAYLDQSLKMASFVQAEVAKKGRMERGVKQAGFLVLFKTYMPSVLVETGFLTHPEEARFLTSSKGQDAIANSIFNAFKSYKTSVESGESGSGKDMKVPAENKEKVNEAPEKKEADEAKPDSEVTTAKKPDESKPEEKPEEKKETNPAAEEPRYTGKLKTAAEKPPEKKTTIEFAVQLLTSTSSIKPGDKRFKGLKDLQEEKAGTIYKYTTRRFSTLDAAIEEQKKIKAAGFQDAFVVPYKDGQRITMKQAREEMKTAN